MRLVLYLFGIAFLLMCPLCIVLTISVYHDFLGVAFAGVGVMAIVGGAIIPRPPARARRYGERYGHRIDHVAEDLERIGRN